MMLERLDAQLVPDDLGEFYEDVALRSEALQPLMYRNPSQQQRFERVLQMAAVLDRRQAALELGCAEGMMTQRLAELYQRVDAAEISSVMLERCPPLPNVRYFWADVTDWIPPRKSYDVVILSEILEHVREPVAMLRRYASVGRRLIVTCPITEPVNRTGAFDATLLGREQRQGDATGHIWYMDMAGFMSWFHGFRVLSAEVVGHSGMVVCESGT